MIKRYFTFGIGHREFHHRYVVIEGDSPEHCRAEMFDRFGKDWATDYTPERFTETFTGGSYVELPPEEWPARSGQWSYDKVTGWKVPE